MSLTLDSNLSLVPIEIRKDSKRFIIENQVSGDFYEMPEICIDAIQLIIQGEQLGKIERELKAKYPYEEVDILNFAEQLIDSDLIDRINGTKIKNQERQKEKLGFLWISSKIGKMFFNKVTHTLYAVLFFLNIVIFILHPSLFPQHDDIFIFDIMVVNVLFWMLFTFLLVLIHEFGHVLAMRALNLPTKLEIGHRLFFVVLLTDMSSVWRLRPKERNVLFLAGLCFDTFILFISLVFQLFLSADHWFLQGLMNFVVFDIVLRMLFQCCIYMKTDLYFVFENVSGCYNLMENAKQTIRQRFSFLKSKSSEEVVFSTEKKTVFIYSLFYFLGVILTVVLYFMFYIPEVIYAAKKLLPGFIQPPTSLLFWDALVFALQVSIFIIVLLYSWRKKYLLHKL
jgi:putative peptide zinc metalloprotease protein